MDSFFLFFDENEKLIAIANDPAALDAAPYDQIVRRHGRQKVDAGLADLLLKMHGGVAVLPDRTVSVTAI